MPSLALAGAAGAGNGLEQVLNRIAEDAKMEQLKKIQNGQLDESVRSHTANEAIDRERIAAAERERISRDAMTNKNYQDQSDRAARDDGRALAEEIPGGTVLDQGDNAISQIQKGGLGGLLRGIRATSATPLEQPNAVGGESTVSSDPDMASFAGKEIPATSRIKLRTQAQNEKKIADERDASRDEAAQGRDEATAAYRERMLNKPQSPSIAIVPTADGIQWVDRRNPAGGAQPLKGAGGEQLQQPDPAAIRTRRDLATSVGSHFQDVHDLLDEADRRGLLGPLKGRTYLEFMSGKVGSTNNPENDELLGELRTQMGMVRSGVAQLHGRAGANQGIAQSIEKKMDEGYMDPNMIRGGLKGLEKWVNTYATKKGSGGGGSASGPADLVFDPATGSFKKPE
jgi:hypothetical protein